jgi:diguanylate cyclase (GGDEF)-like protein/PAS domain S-box-containing protein
MSETTASRITTISRVYLIIALFVALIFCLVLLIQIQMDALIAVRAYVGGEGLWAKGQKDAIRSLEHYVISRNEADYQSCRRFIQVPLGDLKARIELQKSNPNLDIAREGFLKGRNHPADIEYMIPFFHRFQHTPYMAQAIGHWAAADQLIAELNDVAEKLHDEIASGRDKPEAVRVLLIRLDTINLELTEKEDLFSSTLASASRWANDVSRDLTYGLALLFAVLGVGMSWPIITRIRVTENALFESEADLRIAAVAFESQESIMITDADTVILRVNQAFTESTGYTSEEAVGQTPRLLKSGRHNADFYRAMWETLQRTGTWQGEVWDRRKNGEIYPKWLTISAVKGYDGVVTHYVGAHADMTEHKAAEETIKNLAFYDPLTGLPNRRLLMDRLQQSLASSARSGRKGALLFIDLDNFKDINDTLGHDIGDLLLQHTAQRLESCLREVDTVARLGGDEFVVVLEGLSEHAFEAAAQTKTVGEKILATLGQLYQLATHKFHSTPSIGANIFSDHGQSAEELLKQADIAMYQAKKAGRNTLRFFDPQMQVSITARVSLESELRKALENQQFHLYYQIQVDSSHRSLGAEALIRWIHPLRGMVSPAQFIPLAEETGLILSIGQWVLETACTQLKAWEQDALTRDLVLAVNVSAKQFRQADFVAQVQAAMQHHAINPMLLKLELTEGMLLENIEDTIATMNALKEIGVQFSLDDFGTGYSSLQYLKRLPLDQLKIDQPFVRDIAANSSDITIVRTIIAMARSLDMDVIAEGVETEEQRQLLLKNGCSNYQGYLFSKPVPIEQFEALLKQG